MTFSPQFFLASAAQRSILFLIFIPYVGMGIHLYGQAQSTPIPQAARGSSILERADALEVDTIVLIDESVDQVLVLLEQFTGKVILRQQAIPQATINFNSRGPLSREDAILALESLLSLNGVAVVPLNEKFLKAVPTVGVNKQVPTIIGDDIFQQSSSQKIYSKFYQFEYISVTDVLPLIEPFLSAGVSTLIPFESSNSVLITDALINLQRVEAILEKIDRPAEAGEEIFFYSLKYVSASELQGKLNDFQQKSLKRHLTGTTNFEADERTNQLMVFTHKSNIPVLEKLIKRFDVDVVPLTSSEVFYIKHANAEDVTALIESVIKGQQKASEESNRGGAPSTPLKGNTPESSDGAVPQPPAALNPKIQATDIEGVENLQFSEYVTLVSDERSNAIVSYGTASDLRYIKELIDKIDILLAQVRIEVVFTEVDLIGNEVRGIDAFRVEYNREVFDGSVVPPTQDNNIRVAPFAVGALGLQGIALKEFSLDAIFGVAESSSTVRILSAPTIVTTHNQEASINVSQSEPIVTGTTSVTDGGTTSSVSFRDIGIQLIVKPLIGPNGVIQMEIEQIIENRAGETVIDGNVQPIIGKREAKSFVSVKDQETVILGGLQETRPEVTESRLAVLGRIPFLGDTLFTRRTNDEITRELMIFIKPHVINTTEEATEDARRMIDRFPTKGEIDYFLEEGRFSPLEESPTLSLREIERKEKLMAKALRAHNSGEYKEASKLLEKILKIAPSDPPARVLLDAVKVKMEGTEDAL